MVLIGLLWCCCSKKKKKKKARRPLVELTINADSEK